MGFSMLLSIRRFARNATLLLVALSPLVAWAEADGSSPPRPTTAEQADAPKPQFSRLTSDRLSIEITDSELASAAVLTTIRLDEPAREFRHHGAFVFVLHDGLGVTVIDLRNPALPVKELLLGAQSVERMELQGNSRLVLTLPSGETRIFAVANSNKPRALPANAGIDNEIPIANRRASSGMVWVSDRHPGSSFGMLAAGAGQVAYGLGAAIGGGISFKTLKGEDSSIVGATAIPAGAGFNLIPGLILMGIGAYQVASGIEADDSSGQYMKLVDLTQKRSFNFGVMVTGGCITGLSAVFLAAGLPTMFGSGTGFVFVAASSPMSFVGSMMLGIGAHYYTKYDYALDPDSYRAKSRAASTLTSLRAAPYSLPGGMGVLVAGNF